LGLVAVCAALWWWWPSPSVDDAPTVKAEPVVKPPPRRAASTAGPRPAAPVGGNTALPAASADALAIAYPDQQRVECPAGHLADGAYVGSGPGLAPVILVAGGRAVAAVSEAKGEGLVNQHQQPAGAISWRGAVDGAGRCEIGRPVPVRVTGRVADAQGFPAAGALVRGCAPGEVVRTDEDGSFSLSATRGADCYPMAFLELDDGRFGKGTYGEVFATSKDVVNLDLTLPRDDALLSVERQREQAEGMAQLFGRMSDDRRNRFEHITEILADERGEPEALAALRAWHEIEEALLEDTETQIERLLDPEEQIDAFRESWLSLY